MSFIVSVNQLIDELFRTFAKFLRERRELSSVAVISSAASICALEHFCCTIWLCIICMLTST